MQAPISAREAFSFHSNDGDGEEVRHRVGEAELGEMGPEVPVAKGELGRAEEADGSTCLIRGILQIMAE